MSITRWFYYLLPTWLSLKFDHCLFGSGQCDEIIKVKDFAEAVESDGFFDGIC